MPKKIRITPQLEAMVTAAYNLGVHVGKAQAEQETEAERGNGTKPPGPRQWSPIYSADEVEIQNQKGKDGGWLSNNPHQGNGPDIEGVLAHIERPRDGKRSGRGPR